MHGCVLNCETSVIRSSLDLGDMLAPCQPYGSIRDGTIRPGFTHGPNEVDEEPKNVLARVVMCFRKYKVGKNEADGICGTWDKELWPERVKTAVAK